MILKDAANINNDAYVRVNSILYFNKQKCVMGRDVFRTFDWGKITFNPLL